MAVRRWNQRVLESLHRLNTSPNNRSLQLHALDAHRQALFSIKQSVPHLYALLAHTYFMPFALSCVSMLARCFVLIRNSALSLSATSMKTLQNQSTFLAVFHRALQENKEFILLHDRLETGQPCRTVDWSFDAYFPPQFDATLPQKQASVTTIQVAITAQNSTAKHQPKSAPSPLAHDSSSESEPLISIGDTEDALDFFGQQVSTATMELQQSHQQQQKQQKQQNSLADPSDEEFIGFGSDSDESEQKSVPIPPPKASLQQQQQQQQRSKAPPPKPQQLKRPPIGKPSQQPGSVKSAKMLKTLVQRHPKR